VNPEPRERHSFSLGRNVEPEEFIATGKSCFFGGLGHECISRAYTYEQESRQRAVGSFRDSGHFTHTENKTSVLGHFQRPIKLQKSPNGKIRDSKFFKIPPQYSPH
jgi:hypothetical protein